MLPTKFSLRRLGKTYQKLNTALENGVKSAVFYASQNARYHLASQTGHFFVYVTPDRLSARQAVDVLSDYVDGKVLYIPERDDLLINATQNLSSSIADRTLALAEMLYGKAKGVVISVEGLMQPFPSPEVFDKSVIYLKKGMEISLDMLSDKLTLGGYTLTPEVLQSGEFSRRGDVFDVWQAGAELPTRLEFFGDEIESMRAFAPDTMLSVREVDEIIIAPKSDILVSQKLAE